MCITNAFKDNEVKNISIEKKNLKKGYYAKNSTTLIIIIIPSDIPLLIKILRKSKDLK